MLMVQNAKGKTLWTNLLMCYCGADMSQDESHHSRCTPNLARACLNALKIRHRSLTGIRSVSLRHTVCSGHTYSALAACSSCSQGVSYNYLVCTPNWMWLLFCAAVAQLHPIHPLTAAAMPTASSQPPAVLPSTAQTGQLCMPLAIQ